MAPTYPAAQLKRTSIPSELQAVFTLGDFATACAAPCVQILDVFLSARSCSCSLLRMKRPLPVHRLSDQIDQISLINSQNLIAHAKYHIPSKNVRGGLDWLMSDPLKMFEPDQTGL